MVTVTVAKAGTMTVAKTVTVTVTKTVAKAVAKTIATVTVTVFCHRHRTITFLSPFFVTFTVTAFATDFITVTVTARHLFSLSGSITVATDHRLL